MFNREELLKILEKVDDKNIAEKLHSMLFVDDKIVSELIKLFSNKELLKIEKANDANLYYVHLLENTVDIIDVLDKTSKVSFKYKTENTIAEINPITHINIKEMWWHRDMIQVWTNKDVLEYWSKEEIKELEDKLND